MIKITTRIVANYVGKTYEATRKDMQRKGIDKWDVDEVLQYIFDNSKVFKK